MKFGRQLESESVPEWSLHNIDYNTLKEFIKVNTTRHQASAITIPGQTDTALHRFEAEFYDELCRQHDRVGLFVATKADEINRRLRMSRLPLPCPLLAFLVFPCLLCNLDLHMGREALSLVSQFLRARSTDRVTVLSYLFTLSYAPALQG